MSAFVQNNVDDSSRQSREVQVRSLMTEDVISLDIKEDLDLADEVMNAARIEHLPVLHEDKLVGLVTKRDILRIQVSALADIDATESRAIMRAILAGDIMTSPVRTITPDTPALEAARLLARNYGCLPVVEDDELVGIVTATDFLKVVERALEAEADENEDLPRA